LTYGRTRRGLTASIVIKRGGRQALQDC
jgi:hypothetical protein